MDAIKIIIVDNNVVFSRDFKSILETEFSANVVATIDNCEDLLKLKSLKVDIIFINLAMARKNRFHAIKLFLWTYPKINVIGINTFFTEPKYLLRLIEVGFKGCIDGNNIYNELNDAINKVVNGKMFFSKEILERL